MWHYVKVYNMNLPIWISWRKACEGIKFLAFQELQHCCLHTPKVSTTYMGQVSWRLLSLLVILSMEKTMVVMVISELKFVT